MADDTSGNSLVSPATSKVENTLELLQLTCNIFINERLVLQLCILTLESGNLVLLAWEILYIAKEATDR